MEEKEFMNIDPKDREKEPFHHRYIAPVKIEKSKIFNQKDIEMFLTWMIEQGYEHGLKSEKPSRVEFRFPDGENGYLTYRIDDKEELAELEKMMIEAEKK